MKPLESTATMAAYTESLFLHHNIQDDFVMETPHFHEGIEIHLSLAPKATFYIDDRVYHLTPGALTLISSSDIHRVTTKQGRRYERYIVSFVPEYLSDIAPLSEDLFSLFFHRPKNFHHSRQLSALQQKQFVHHFEQLQGYLEPSTYAGALRSKLELSQLLLLCNETFQTLHQAADESQSFLRLRPILNYIKENPAEDLRLDTLCQKFYLSRAHLIRLFKQEMDMTPNEYIIVTRIMKSREYLKQGLPVQKTCGLVGYLDESHFIRMFRRVVGTTPKQYSLLHHY